MEKTAKRAVNLDVTFPVDAMVKTARYYAMSDLTSHFTTGPATNSSARRPFPSVPVQCGNLKMEKAFISEPKAFMV
jgi:hypothetical protein